MKCVGGIILGVERRFQAKMIFFQFWPMSGGQISDPVEWFLVNSSRKICEVISPQIGKLTAQDVAN